MIEKILRLGDKIEIVRTTFTSNGQASQKVYLSQLLDINGDYDVNVAVPIEGGHLVPLDVGKKYDIRFFTANGVYGCRSEVVGRFKQGNFYFLQMKLLSDLKKDQRRQYYRLDKIIPMKYHVVSEEENRIREILSRHMYLGGRDKRIVEARLRDASSEDINGTISNISGGGVKFVSRMKHQAGELLKMEFYLDEEDVSTFMSQLGRIVYADSGRNQNNMYESRVEFVDIDRLEREKIVKFVFNEERKIRKREKGF